HTLSLFFLMLRLPRGFTLFPYTTLFRSRIPSRIVYGISLREDFIDRPLITWIEVNNEQRWSGFNPETGEQGYPDNFFPWLRGQRSEEHTSELQSRENLVCRLLLEKKKNT